MLKKAILVLVLASFLATPKVVFADEVVCPQPYGGGVVCGVHTPVATGIGDNLPVIGASLIGASILLAFIGKKLARA